MFSAIFGTISKRKAMKIGFDAKRIFHNNTGLGNYGRDAIRILHQYTPISKFDTL